MKSSSRCFSISYGWRGFSGIAARMKNALTQALKAFGKSISINVQLTHMLKSIQIDAP